MPRSGAIRGAGRTVRRGTDRCAFGSGAAANAAADSVSGARSDDVADGAAALDGAAAELAAEARGAAHHGAEPVAAARSDDGVRLFDFMVCSGVMADGERWAGVRRAGDRAHGQQDQTAGGGAGQRGDEQGAGSVAGHGAGGTAISCSPGSVSQFVNAMAELSTNRARNSGQIDDPSQYARMIPGTSTLPAVMFPAAGSSSGPADGGESTPRENNRWENKPRENKARGTKTRTPIQQLLHRPASGQRELFKLVVVDLLVLGAIGGGLALISPGWSVPWANLPIFAVLVTLFGCSAGLYSNSDDPFPAGIIAVLGESIFLATGLVFVAARGQMRALGGAAILTSSLGGLLLWRRLLQMMGTRGEARAWKILIVGGGPLALAVASTLRNDPLHRTNVCGFLDDVLPFSPVVLGRLADLDWLARSEFIDEVILVLPGQPAQTRLAAEAAFRNHLDIRTVPDLPP